MTADRTTSADMLDMLRRHYLPEGRPAAGLFAPEIASPCGRRRADLLWVPTSRTGSHSDNIIGHEIKVSRSDVMAELADPTKADPWAQHCTRWWLVVSDPALIEGLPIPEMWGVMAPPSGRRTRSMTIVKEAPKLRPTGDLAEALTRLMAFVLARVETRVADLEREVKWRDQTIERQERTITELRNAAEYGGSLSPHATRLTRILAEVKKRSRDIGWWVREVNDDDVVAALVDHAAMVAATRSAHDELERIITMCTDPLSHAREQLRAALDGSRP